MRSFFAIAAIWVLMVAALLLYSGRLPQDVWQWVILLVFGPPVWLLLQLLGEMLGNSLGLLPGVRHMDNVVRMRTARERLSGLRIVWGVVRMLLLIALVAGATWLYRYFTQ